MIRRASPPMLVLLCTLTTGCLTTGWTATRSFVDPGFPPGTYESVERLPQPLPLRVAVAFQRNGEPFPRVEPELREIVERTLRASGVVVPSGSAEGEVRVVVNNVGDRAVAVAQGFGTGLTLGLVGATVTDGYEMSATVTCQGRTVARTGLKHALRAAVGNTSLPPGVEATTPSAAFARVVESTLLRASADMQRSGDLPRAVAPPRVS